MFFFGGLDCLCVVRYIWLGCGCLCVYGYAVLVVVVVWCGCLCFVEVDNIYFCVTLTTCIYTKTLGCGIMCAADMLRLLI